jgi:hypothetical protein
VRPGRANSRPTFEWVRRWMQPTCLASLEKICRALDVTPGDLPELIDAPPKPKRKHMPKKKQKAGSCRPSSQLDASTLLCPTSRASYNRIMPQPVEACVYCSTSFNPTKGEGDHIVPAQLGEFRNDVRFRRICPLCNNRIGRSEQQFLQCGPEAIFRQIVAPASPRRRTRGRSPGHGAYGMPPPRFTMNCGDHRQIVRPLSDRPGDAEFIDQLVVRSEDGNDHQFQLFPGLQADQLRDRVESAGIKDFETAWLHCDQANWEEFVALVQAAWPNKGLSELAPTEPGLHKAEGRITFTFSDHYFRAIAKIAFHYYLVHSRRGVRGDEAEFAPVRRFILEGGDASDFFDTPGPRFAVPFGELPTGGAITPAHWCHVLAVYEASEVVVGYVHLFAGPGCVRKPHHVRLAQLASRIVLPVGIFGHVYLYEKDQTKIGYAGRVVPASFSRFQ